MLNVGQIEEGFVLDHIDAGKSLKIYHDLKLDQPDCTVAIIKNARTQDVSHLLSRSSHIYLFLLIRKKNYIAANIVKRPTQANKSI